jgi:hypothetical protein
MCRGASFVSAVAQQVGRPMTFPSLETISSYYAHPFVHICMYQPWALTVVSAEQFKLLA